jgi:TRAP-type C4-dicarboxylate transport system permease small subunit
VQGGWAFALSAALKITPVMHWTYTWVDMAVPVGAAMMSIRLVISTVRQLNRVIRGTPPPVEQPGEAYTA